MNLILKFGLLFTILAIPLYFIANTLFLPTIYSIVFFSLVWFAILFLSSFLLNKKIEPILISFTLNIGFKFFHSLLFVFAMYKLHIFEGKIIVLIFMLLYFIYSFLLIKFNSVKIE